MWQKIQETITQLMLGPGDNHPVGTPNLTAWQAQADWVVINGDYRLMAGDDNPFGAHSLLGLSAVVTSLWRMGTVVVLLYHWDGEALTLSIGRSRSAEYGAQAILGLFPLEMRNGFLAIGRDPIPACRSRWNVGLKLRGRPGTEKLISCSASEAMALAAGATRTSFLAVLTPLPTQTIVSTVHSLQNAVRACFNPNQVSDSDFLTGSMVELAKAERSYLMRGAAIGLWAGRCYLLSENPDVQERVAAAMLTSWPPNQAGLSLISWDAIDCRVQNPGSETVIHSEDLATLFALPYRAVPGFRIEMHAGFHSGSEANRGPSLGIGFPLHRGIKQKAELQLNLEDLRRHVLICGLTGSGKTTTSFKLLVELWRDHRVPWLVIEPVKGDYWRLHQADQSTGSSPLNNLRLLTLGDATPGRSAPISLNPFYFPEGIPLSTHIDLLKSIFFAAFVLYPPMPYVLETALAKTYQRAGWDLVTSDWGHGRREARIPTFSDFVATVDSVCDSLGYQGELSANVRAALMVRLDNLRNGGKGLLLDGPSSWRIERLLDRPTVAELRAFGNDEEKAFIAGLLFMLLYEHREAEALTSVTSDSLRHVVILEEAHRLLRRTELDQGTEGGNVRGLAVERITAMLTEIRSYGQGVIVIDQSPEKLAADAVKNTSTKIVHRLIAAEDREVIGRAVNLQPEQDRELAALYPGQAVVAKEGLLEPALVEVPRLDVPTGAGQLRERLMRRDATRTEQHGGLSAPFAVHCSGCSAVGNGSCGAERIKARSFLLNQAGRRFTAKLWLHVATGKKSPLEIFESLSSELPSSSQAAAIKCLTAQLPKHLVRLALATQRSLVERTDALEAQLAEALSSTAHRPFSLKVFSSGRFRFPECAAWCTRPCLLAGAVEETFRPDVQLLTAAQQELDQPSSNPLHLTDRITETLLRSALFTGKAPTKIIICALIITADYLKGDAKPRKDLVDRTLVAFAKKVSAQGAKP